MLDLDELPRTDPSRQPGGQPLPDRRTKIVCTLGPATSTPSGIAALVAAGMDVARLNFSHGQREDHATACALVRDAAAAAGREIGILADLQGPKIRLGRFASGPVVWPTGKTVVITTQDCAGGPDRVGTTYAGLAHDIKPGDRLLVDDGKVALQAVEVVGDDVRCLVTEGGPVSDNKGLSLPGVAVGVPPLSAKDLLDLRFALDLKVDMLAMSFVRTPSEVKLMRAVMEEVGVWRPIIVKLEKPEAVEDLEGIVAAFDGVMVARGDLGVELPLEQVPLVQKRAIQLCREMAKPVIVATQMLESMIQQSRPTRAEVSDVANAVLDGADAVMLSGETSVGKCPGAGRGDDGKGRRLGGERFDPGPRAWPQPPNQRWRDRSRGVRSRPHPGRQGAVLLQPDRGHGPTPGQTSLAPAASCLHPRPTRPETNCR